MKRIAQAFGLTIMLFCVVNVQADNQKGDEPEVSTNIVFSADESTPAQALVRQDPVLVGTWVGRTSGKPDVVGCIAYDWRTERAADGTLKYTAFDAHSSLLVDKGRWWTEGDTYYEVIDGGSEYKYRYQLEGNELTLRSRNKEEQTCLTDKTMSERKAEAPAS